MECQFAQIAGNGHQVSRASCRTARSFPWGYRRFPLASRLQRRILLTAPWTWRPYKGKNPHTAHIHISVESRKSLYDDKRPWLLGHD